MFLGEYQISFTGKGRIVLPRKMRLELRQREIVLSRGFEGCVLGFALEDWELEARNQLAIPLTDEKGRFIRRYLFSGSERVVLDAQGRFVIPSKLMDFGNLGNDVVIVGAGDHFEIWDWGLWKKHITRIEEEYAR
ncbi:division/cell wall cluster transcriptional repressor MraZ [Candidatus Daviesbacteria bacterium]|nr:division/cell wall cluster transcriptional repressor MraZ [Candidatus Daviesbacteria bacterium]